MVRTLGRLRITDLLDIPLAVSVEVILERVTEHERPTLP